MGVHSAHAHGHRQSQKKIRLSKFEFAREAANSKEACVVSSQVLCRIAHRCIV